MSWPASIFIALLTAVLGLFVAGVVIGLIASRMVAGGAHPGFLRGLGMSFGVVIGIAALRAAASSPTRR